MQSVSAKRQQNPKKIPPIKERLSLHAPIYKILITVLYFLVPSKPQQIQIKIKKLFHSTRFSRREKIINFFSKIEQKKTFDLKLNFNFDNVLIFSFCVSLMSTVFISLSRLIEDKTFVNNFICYIFDKIECFCI